MNTLIINTHDGREFVPAGNAVARLASMPVPPLRAGLAAQIEAMQISAAHQTMMTGRRASLRASSSDGTPLRVIERLPALLDALPSAGAKDGLTAVALAEKLGWSISMLHEVVAHAVKAKAIVRHMRGSGVGSVIYFKPLGGQP